MEIKKRPSKTNCWAPLKEKYKLLEFIAEGAFGKVCKARERESKKMVAIKMMKFDPNSLYEFKKVFREVSLLR